VEEGVAKVMVNEISLMEDLLRKTKSLTFRLEKLKPDEFQSLHSILLEFQGQTQIKLSMFLTDFQKSIELDCEDIKGVQMSNEFFENLQSTLGRTDFVEVGI
jgi:DNA polymerase-3 subunit alpha